MYWCIDTFQRFVRNQLQFSLFYPGTKQTTSRTDKKMIAIRLFNGSYFTNNRRRYIQGLSSMDIIPGDTVFTAQPYTVILVQITVIQKCLRLISDQLRVHINQFEFIML